MARSTAFNVRIAALAFGMLLGVRCGAVDSVAAIEEEMKGETYSEITAEQFAARNGTAALPALYSILKSSASIHTKTKVCFYLGKIGEPSAINPIIDFLEQPLTEPLTPQVYADWGLAQHGLGYIGADAALDYLEKRFSRQYWATRSTSENFVLPGHSNEGTIDELRKQALRAISSAGNLSAEKRIEKLRKTPDGISDTDFREAKTENDDRRSGQYLIKRNSSRAVP